MAPCPPLATARLVAIIFSKCLITGYFLLREKRVLPPNANKLNVCKSWRDVHMVSVSKLNLGETV